MADEITHNAHPDRGGFAIMRGEQRLGLLTYSLQNGVMTILHTEVDDEIRGTGAGQRLVEAAAQWARDEGHHVMPLCSFARTVFSRTNEYDDVLSHV
jgi:uncharacterized protein